MEGPRLWMQDALTGPLWALRVVDREVKDPSPNAALAPARKLDIPLSVLEPFS